MLDRQGTRMAFVIVLLAVTFAVTAVMAIRAQKEAAYRRITAERVVRDWTRVAADELTRRAEAQAGFYGAYPLLLKIGEAAGLPSPEDLRRTAAKPEERRNASMVKTTFRQGGGSLVTLPPLPEPLRAQLKQRLDTLGSDVDQPLHIDERTFVCSRAGETLHGFEIDRSRLGPFFELAMTMRPLLPPSLGNGRITNDTFYARALDPSGRQIFATSGSYDPQLGVRRRAESEGLMRGMTVEASLAPEAAQLLVMGGIPRTLPTHFVLLGVTALLLVTAVLQIRRERAVSRMRSDFVASVSHELRTPLTQIRMFAETLRLDRIRTDDERRRSLEIIDQEARRLSQLVENLLQFSRGERKKLRVVTRPADVGALVRDTVDAFLPIAQARQMKISTSIEENVRAAVDEDALRGALLNLLDNAVKYGPERQEIGVEVRHDGGVVQISVEDQGPGVPLRQRKRIWRRYARLDGETERAIAGAGIGLAVVRDVVAQHGGRVWCESGARGGARFVIEIPAEVPA